MPAGLRKKKTFLRGDLSLDKPTLEQPSLLSHRHLREAHSLPTAFGSDGDSFMPLVFGGDFSALLTRGHLGSV